MVKKSPACQQGDGLFTRIDQIEVLIRFSRCRAHAQNAVLAVQDDFQTGWQVVGHHGRHANAQIHIGPIGDVLGHQGGDLVFASAGVCHLNLMP